MELKRYTLMQMPNESIIITDDSTKAGQNRICQLIDEGGQPAGTIDSHLPIETLKSGFFKEGGERK